MPFTFLPRMPSRLGVLAASRRVDIIARHMTSKATLSEVQEVIDFLAHVTRFSKHGGSLAARQIRRKRWSAEVYSQPAVKTQCPEHANAHEFGVSNRGTYHAVVLLSRVAIRQT